MRKPKGQTDEVNRLNSPWQMGRVVQACSTGLSVQKSTKIAAFGDAQHTTSGLEEGRAQHGHSSGAHSTPRNQCRDARVVARWLFVHQLSERWIKRPLGLVCMLGNADMWTGGW